jgi:hypothetical protein
MQSRNIQSVGTQCGLFRHYWDLAKLLLTVFATMGLLIKMERISYAARFSPRSIWRPVDVMKRRFAPGRVASIRNTSRQADIIDF